MLFFCAYSIKSDSTLLADMIPDGASTPLASLGLVRCLIGAAGMSAVQSASDGIEAE